MLNIKKNIKVLQKSLCTIYIEICMDTQHLLCKLRYLIFKLIKKYLHTKTIKTVTKAQK